MKESKEKSIAVLGLGRFGMGVVRILSEYNVDLLVCDKDPARLHAASAYAAYAVQADLSDETALQQLSLGDYDVVVLAMGEDFEASMLATMMAKEQGVRTVVSKARGLRQKKILERIGADVVVLPEFEMGAKVARGLMRSNFVRVFENNEYLDAIEEMYPRPEWLGKTIREADIRNKYNMTVLAVCRDGKVCVPAPLDRPLRENDLLITLDAEDGKNE